MLWLRPGHSFVFSAVDVAWKKSKTELRPGYNTQTTHQEIYFSVNEGNTTHPPKQNLTKSIRRKI